MGSRALAVFALSLLACGAPSRPEVSTTPIASATPKPATKTPREGLCPQTEAFMGSLAQPMTIEAYVMKGHPKLDAFVRELGTLLDRVAEASHGKVHVTIIDTTTSEEALTRAKEQGLIENEMTDDAGNAYASGILGVVMTYGAERDSIKMLAPTDPGSVEFWLLSKLREIRDKGDAKKRTVGVVVGHGEIALTEENLIPATGGDGPKPSIARILTQYFPQFRVVDVDLAKPIDPAMSGLLVLQPERDLADADLRAIDRFVMSGKTVAIVASAVNVARGDATMQATLARHGLERLTLGYGIELAEDALLDFGSPFKIKIATTQGESSLRLPALLDVRDERIDTRFPVFFRLSELVFPFASSLALHPEKQPAASVRVHARTTEKTIRETKHTIDLTPMRRWTPRGVFGQFAIAASASGKLRSAFDPSVSATKPARVLVLSSSQFFANPLARAGNDEVLQQLALPYAQRVVVNSILVAKGLVEWLAYDDDVGACALAP